jgi:phospholipase C
MRFTTSILLLVSVAAAITHAQTLPHFDHIVVVFQENRTPDNLFGSAPSSGLCGSEDRSSPASTSKTAARTK